MKEKVKEQFDELEAVAKPVVEYIRKNYHPHVTVIIDFDHVEVLEGVKAMQIPYSD